MNQKKASRGMCKAYVPKYFFNQETGLCEEFIWGECDGIVPFDTLIDCQQKCE